MSNVCATGRESLELIHKIQCDFPKAWRRQYDPRAPPSIESLEGVRSVTIRGDMSIWGCDHAPRFSSGIAAQFPLSLRFLHIAGEPSAEVWDVLPSLEHLDTLRVERCSLITDLRAEMLPPGLRVLRVIDCPQLVSVHSLPTQLECLSVCSLCHLFLVWLDMNRIVCPSAGLHGLCVCVNDVLSFERDGEGELLKKL